ncbi:MAG TPA: hypothetical protein VFB60_11785 [Ktedonobacteraceae bacterium]|nr:hypothetical protein [Ktedonobacteraceae bacterium]
MNTNEEMRPLAEWSDEKLEAARQDAISCIQDLQKPEMAALPYSQQSVRQYLLKSADKLITAIEQEQAGRLAGKLARVVDELLSTWGYRDITRLIRRELKRQAEEFGEPAAPFRYLCVLQAPGGSPVYCRTLDRVMKELAKARAAAVEYIHCPAPDPEANLWMVMGNFEPEEGGSTDTPAKASQEPVKPPETGESRKASRRGDRLHLTIVKHRSEHRKER